MKNIFGRIKLKWKIFGFLLGFCFILIILLWIFQLNLLEEFYRRVRIAETRSDVAYIMEHLYDDDIREIVEETSELGNFTVSIVDFEGENPS